MHPPLNHLGLPPPQFSPRAIGRRANRLQTFPLAPSGKSHLEARPSRARKEGRIAIVTDVGRGMRWMLWAAQDGRG
jgi:hypothetical protein